MTYCGSMYIIQLWCIYTKKQYKNIIFACNNVFSKFLGYDRYCSASGMFVDSRVDTFNVRFWRMVYNFRERICNSENNLIKCIVNSTVWKGSDLLFSWNSILYYVNIVHVHAYYYSNILLFLNINFNFYFLFCFACFISQLMGSMYIIHAMEACNNDYYYIPWQTWYHCPHSDS